MAFSQAEALAKSAQDGRRISRKDLFLRALRLERARTMDAQTRSLLNGHVVRGLFLYAPGILFIEAVAAVLVAVVFWRNGHDMIIGAWLALIMATCVLRWLHVLRFFAAERTSAETRQWSRLFTQGTCMSGVLWGIGNLAFYAPDYGILLLVQVFLVTGLSAAALVGYAANMSTFYAFVPAVVLPFGACLALGGVPAHLFTATLLAVWVSVIVFLAHDLNQHIVDRILLLDRAMLTETMQHARDSAVAENQAKTRLLANVSHELRTPLNSIIGFSEIMSAEMFGLHAVGRYRDYSRNIRASGTQLLYLIDDLVDAAKVEAGTSRLNETSVAVAELVDQCENSLKFEAREGNITLTTFVPKDLPPIKVDARRFRQAVLNLLSNAVKFTPGGGIVLLIVSRDAADNMVFRIKDNGIGMRKVSIPEKFLPFAQPERSSKVDTAAGLGLALAKIVIDAHGGELSLESELGVGTTATIRVPAARVLASESAASGDLRRAA